jgi:hypothetical protein
VCVYVCTCVCVCVHVCVCVCVISSRIMTRIDVILSNELKLTMRVLEMVLHVIAVASSSVNL